MVKALQLIFSYFSPYDSLYQPLDAAIAQAQKQNLNPQETEQFVMNLMFGEDGPVAKFLEPFISEPLGFDRFYRCDYKKW